MNYYSKKGTEGWRMWDGFVGSIFDPGETLLLDTSKKNLLDVSCN